jgi:Zn-dependent metalloprotease
MPDRCRCCFVVPPHLLRQVAETPDHPQAAAAANSLQMSNHLVSTRAATAAATAPAGAAALTHSVFTCNNGVSLPGSLVKSSADQQVADDAANQAFDNTATTWRFYQEVLGRNSIDGNGGPLTSSVHYDIHYMNAMWNGQQMLYGDGDGQMLRGFTAALDVIAHELTHGVTNATAALGHVGMSGALNEHFSDVFASLVKQWSLNQTAAQGDWLIGNSVLGPAFQGRALRDMANPGTAYDNPVYHKDPQPGHMSGYVHLPDTVDRGGAHINSGIPNRAFVLAAQSIGGNAWEVAGRIWYTVLTQKIGPDADFKTCALATLDVAKGHDASVAGKIARAWLTTGVLTDGDVTTAGVLTAA